MKKNIISLAVGAILTAIVLTPVQASADPVCENGICQVVFDYTGGPQTFLVPAGVGSLDFKVSGAQGARGGRGGQVEGTLVGLPETLEIYVGGAGSLGALTQGGFNGGGQAGGNRGNEGSGGGASDIRTDSSLNSRLVVAGGGGGGGGFSGTEGAPGGLLIAAAAQNAQGGGGQGGTQVSGGAKGTSNGGDSATAGTFGQGGTGGISWNAGGGGGGGGWFGGGGGGGDDDQCCSDGGGGGGGSSYADAMFTFNVLHLAGVQSGNGQVILSYQVPLEVSTISVSQQTNALATAQITFNRPISELAPEFFAVDGGVCDLSDPVFDSNAVSIDILNCTSEQAYFRLLASAPSGNASGLAVDFVTPISLDLSYPKFQIVNQDPRFKTSDLLLDYQLDDLATVLSPENFQIFGCEMVDLTKTTQIQLSITGCADGEVTLLVYPNTFVDAFGNFGPMEPVEYRFQIDTKAPVAIWSDVQISGEGPFSYVANLSFSEPVIFDPESTVFQSDIDCETGVTQTPTDWEFTAICGYGSGRWVIEGAMFEDLFGNPGLQQEVAISFTNLEPVIAIPTPTPTPTPTPAPVTTPSPAPNPASTNAPLLPDSEVSDSPPNSSQPQADPEEEPAIEPSPETLAETPMESPEPEAVSTDLSQDQEISKVLEQEPSIASNEIGAPALEPEEFDLDASEQEESGGVVPLDSDDILERPGQTLAQPVAGPAVEVNSGSSPPWMPFVLLGFVVLLGAGVWRFSGR